MSHICVCVCIYIYTHTHNAVLHLKEWNNAIFSNMDGSTDYHTKKSKSDRERQIACNITYMWNLKKKWDEWIYLQNRKEELTNIENKLWLPKGKGYRWGWIN